jgi:glycolate oxidase FAD binding subunit
MNRWAGEPLPISATCYHDQVLTLRLSGAETAVQAAQAKLGGQALAAGDEFWRGIREQSANFFRGNAPLWRLSVPSTAELDLPGKLLIEWGGALRWMFTEAEAGAVRAVAERVNGQATMFRGATKPQSVFHSLPKPLMDVHRRMKRAFDPHGIFNLGRMYSDF